MQVNTHFDGIINHLHHMIFEANQEQNETYTFEEMMKQEYKGDFVMTMLKEVQDHETGISLDINP